MAMGGDKGVIPNFTVMTAVAANFDSGLLLNQGNRGILVTISTTANTGTSPTLTVTIKGYDPQSGVYRTILASAAISTNTTTYLEVYPGLTASANAVASDVLPTQYRVYAVLGGTTPTWTGTIAINELH